MQLVDGVVGGHEETLGEVTGVAGLTSDVVVAVNEHSNAGSTSHFPTSAPGSPPQGTMSLPQSVYGAR